VVPSLPVRYLFFSLLLLLFGQAPVVKNIRNLTAGFTVPLQYGLTVSAQNLKKPLVFLAELATLKSENERLRMSLEDLEGELGQLKDVARENELLREQARLVGDLNLGKEMVLASVVGRGMPEGSYLLLDKGTAAGLKGGMVVVYKNFLVGEVVTVEPRLAKVRTIFDPRFRAPAVSLDAPGHTRGLVRGEFATSLLMEKILPSEKVTVGERIVTSGEGGYPTNLLLGRVKEVSAGAAEVLKWARLTPLIEMDTLERVFVIRE
jgi:rod shape-determining protein MreC